MFVRLPQRISLFVAATLGLAAGACNKGENGGLLDRGSCDVLIECAASLAPESRDEYEEIYGPAGLCWQSGPDSWAACRNSCATTLDTLNLAGMATGETCGTCSVPQDCAEFGVGAFCDNGLCAGGSGDGMADDETGGSGDGDGDGDGDGNPFTGIESVSYLLVVDNSSSMGWLQQLFALDADNLVAPLDAAGIPWRVGITTTDNGNPWCQAGVTTPEGGKLVFSSCRTRLGDFLAGNDIDVQAACEQLCDTTNIEPAPSTTAYDPSPKPRPWIESFNGQTNLPASVSVTEALHCLVPQGVNGCGFESQLDSAFLAITRARSNLEASYGFIDEGSLTVVIFFSDEADCSYNKNWSEIFEADGNKAFWSDPTAQFPTSAVCWNAGVECEESGSGYDCVPADKDVTGNPTSDPDAAVLYPLERFADGFDDAGAVLTFGILGVGADGEPSYYDSPNDPSFMESFGIGPGCSAPSSFGEVTAVPPVRMWNLLQQFGPASGQAAYSICAQNYSAALTEIGETVASYF